MPIGPARMPLFDHLGELRMRVVRIAVTMLIAVCVFYLASPTVGQFLLAPVASLVPQTAEGLPAINVFGAFDAFSLRFVISFWVSLVACMPVILWQLLAFFLPALKPKERKWFIPTFAAGVGLFIFGTVFCYLVILFPSFQWMLGQADGFVNVLPEASQWINLIIKFEICFGFGFELPLVVFYLVVFGVLPYKKLRASWRVVYLSLMVISAIVTPDASPVTMILMFIPLVALYEASLLVARLALGNKLKKQTEDYLAKKAEKDAEKKDQAKERLAQKALKSS